MSDHDENQPTDATAEAASTAPAETLNETSVQRALRLKKAKIDARPKPPTGGRFQREQNARIKAGTSRPWMSK